MRRLAIVLALLALPTAASAQQDPPELGPRFAGEFSGLTFRPPGGLLRVPERAGELARYRSETGPGEPPATFIAERVELPGRGLPLLGRAAPGGESPETPGLLGEVAKPFGADASAVVHRRDVVYVNDADVGVLAIETRGVPHRQLTQLALVRVSDNVYYRLTHAVPLPPDGAVAESPEARAAAATFAAVLDTTRLVDRSDVRARQEQWLINTRNLFVNWTRERVLEALVGERHFRVLVDGADAGYLHVTEVPADGLPAADGGAAGAAGAAFGDADPDKDGVRVGLRSHFRDADGRVVDRETFAYRRFNRTPGDGRPRERSRDREEWQTTRVFRDASTTDLPLDDPQLAFVTEIGASQRRTVIEADAYAEGGDGNRGVVTRQEHVLTVTRAGRDGADEPLERELPPFYVSQAYSHLLPRLVPLDRERGYMVAEWVPARSEVMARYVEVGPVEEVELAGRALRARVVTDRIGLDGSVTEHYFDPENGTYQGSRDEAARRVTLPSTAGELRAIWGEVSAPPDAATPRTTPQTTP